MVGGRCGKESVSGVLGVGVREVREDYVDLAAACGYGRMGWWLGVECGSCSCNAEERECDD